MFKLRYYRKMRAREFKALSAVNSFTVICRYCGQCYFASLPKGRRGRRRAMLAAIRSVYRCAK